MTDIYASGSIRSQYLDPVSFVPNSRAAFNLDSDKVAYLSNMRLLDLGCTASSAEGYSRGLGCLALIKNIRLMDARTELGALRNPAQYLFFKNSNRTNSDNKSSDKYLKRNNLGQTVNSVDGKIASVQGNGGGADTAASGNTRLGYLDLREIFPMLNQVSILPTSVFKNLRIEIEFESKLARQVLTDTTKTFDIARPVLVCDFTDNMELVSQSSEMLMQRGIMWNEIENDNFTISDGGQQENVEVRQEVQFQSLAYKGKFIERMLICKQLVDVSDEVAAGGAVNGYGGVASSQAWLQQNTQVRMNGRNVLPGFNGATGDNERLAMVADEWGVTTMVPGSNYYQWTQMAALNTDPLYAGQQSWDCIRLGARVSELQVQLSRINNNDAAASGKTPTNDPCVINLYAEARKILTMNKDMTYTVVYG